MEDLERDKMLASTYQLRDRELEPFSFEDPFSDVNTDEKSKLLVEFMTQNNTLKEFVEILKAERASSLAYKSKFEEEHNLNQSLQTRAVELHIRECWVLLYIKRWLKVPYQTKAGEQIERTMGVPRCPLLVGLSCRKRTESVLSLANRICTLCTSQEDGKNTKSRVIRRLSRTVPREAWGEIPLVYSTTIHTPTVW